MDLNDVEMIPGGVEFTGTVQDCFRANLFLRSPSRIIMRLARFKAENFRSLEKKLALVEWELYLKKSAPVKCEVSTSHCRLYHKDAIAQRAGQSIRSHFDRLSGTDCTADSTAGHILMIRGENDFFEISLDSSGDLLHKRGIKREVGAAPLRENLAFAILSATNYSGELPLIDGMCGSGSFALEAAMIACNIPPGYFRSFAFEQWPCFSPAQWNYIKKEASQDMEHFEKPSVFAMDQDDAMVEHLAGALRHVDLLSSIMVMQQDFFALQPETLTQSRGIVVLNPPYGKRIGDKKDIEGLFREIAAKFRSDFKGWRAGVILPDRALMNCFPVSGSSLIPLFHGGLELHAAILQL